jgi:putative CocE/NonD family hydrolase
MLKRILALSLLFVALPANSQIKSIYVPTKDSTLLAVDVHFPLIYKSEALPVLVIFTRYWRAAINNKTKDRNVPLNGLDAFFSKAGYIIVKVDVRGTGASFGTRTGEYTPQEVMDAKDILDWIVQQDWCDGNIGSYGTSYEGTTAELLCATQHPAVKAVIPGWSDFDVYRSPVRPYGMLASSFIRKWSVYVRLLDRNKSLFLGESIKPVDDNLLKSAIKDHKSNPNIFKLTTTSSYRNADKGEMDYERCSPVSWKREIEESQVPMLILSSWFDAGTVEGSLQRFENFSNPQYLVLMATSHGGWSNASPFTVSDKPLPPTPSALSQAQTQLDFLDHHLKGEDKGLSRWPKVRFYNLGEEKFYRTEIWPPKGIENKKFYFHAKNELSGTLPEGENASNSYKVNNKTTTGDKNRWTTQMGGPVLNLNDRSKMDDMMLSYTSDPMISSLQITGTPIITLQISSNKKQGAIFVYLEDVDENGISRYITEGGLDLSHRKLQENTKGFNLHSFNEEDQSPMPIDEIQEVKIRLWPTSISIQAGHALRISIAGTDVDTFDKVPKHGKPTYTVYCHKLNSSFIELPLAKEAFEEIK